jgi:hypothetical protein
VVKLVQICASSNDLFGLDGDGIVYQYNFSINAWMRLGHGRRDHEEPPSAPTEPPATRRAARDPTSTRRTNKANL